MTKKGASSLIGAHLSISGGHYKAFEQAVEIGANTMQIFTANQKQWSPKSITEEGQQLWEEHRKDSGVSHIMSHASYLINLGSPREEVYTKSQQAMRSEIERCHKLKIDYLNFHPGAALTLSPEECMDRIVKNLLSLEKEIHKGKTLLVLEATAGQGTCIGHRFEELSYIIERVKGKIPIGVCIDTCHIFAAGYDISTKVGWEKVLDEFKRVVGISYLKALHVNDSKFPCGSRKDRHASLGKGEIGIEGFKAMMKLCQLEKLPKYLETPEPALWEEEIALLRSFV